VKWTPMWISFPQKKLEILAETEYFISIDSGDSGITNSHPA